MARINIEECWWSDPRRIKLGELLGKVRYADALAIQAWRLSQEFWSKCELVPWHVFSALDGGIHLLESGLARLHESLDPKSKIHLGTERDPNELQRMYVYVRGSSERLSWVRDQRLQASEAGKKSAESRRKKNGSAQPKGGKGDSNPNGNGTKVNGTEPSGSYSVSGSDSVSDSDSGSGNFSGERFEKRITAIACFSSLESVFQERNVSEKVQDTWIKAFPDSEWVTEEIRKALAWEAANPSRKKKNFAAFITRWLTKGWDTRKTPSSQSTYPHAADRRSQGNQAALAAFLNSVEEHENEQTG